MMQSEIISYRLFSSRVTPICKTQKLKFPLNVKRLSSPSSSSSRPSLLCSVTKLLDIFLRHTTIPCLSQLPYRKLTFSKIGWILLFIAGVIMALYHSQSLITDYNEYAVTEYRETRLLRMRYFPAVTICNNNPIQWKAENEMMDKLEKMNLHHLKQRFQYFYKLQNSKNNTKEFSILEADFLKILNNLNEDQRLELGVSIESFIVAWWWENEAYNLSELLVFNNLYYGTCITFNHGLFNQKKIRSSSKSALTAILRLDADETFPFLYRDFGATLTIHMHKTAPDLNPLRIVNIYPGVWIRIGLTKFQRINRLPYPFKSNCVNPADEYLRAKNVFYTERRPYIYSVYACLETCNKVEILKNCNCVDPYLPIQPNETACDIEDCGGLNAYGEEKCECPLPCKSFDIETKITYDINWLRLKSWQNLLESNGISTKSEENKTWLYNNIVGVEVFWESLLYEIAYQKPKITLTDFMGSLGGNLGLWIGISVMSFLEILEVTLIALYVVASDLIYKWTRFVSRIRQKKRIFNVT